MFETVEDGKKNLVYNKASKTISKLFINGGDCEDRIKEEFRIFVVPEVILLINLILIMKTFSRHMRGY